MGAEENKSSKSKFIIIIISIILALPMLTGKWVLFYAAPIKGYVVDAKTGKPLENVVVVGMWQLTQFLGQGFGGYAKVSVTETDREGKFKLPFWITVKPWTAMSSMDDLAPKIIIYKPGYKVYWSHKLMRLGYPNDYSKHEDEKNHVKKQYSINPARLQRLNIDEEIYKNFNEFESQADFPYYYSKKQMVEMFNVLEDDVFKIAEENNKSKKLILKEINEYRKYWIEGTR